MLPKRGVQRATSAVCLLVLVLALPACGGGGLQDGPGRIVPTDYVSEVETTFRITSPLPANPGERARVRFRAVEGTPFDGGISAVIDVPVLSNAGGDLVGVMPPTYCADPVTAEVTVLRPRTLDTQPVRDPVVITPTWPHVSAISLTVLPNDRDTRIQLSGRRLGESGQTLTCRLVAEEGHPFLNGTASTFEIEGAVESAERATVLVPRTDVPGSTLATLEVLFPENQVTGQSSFDVLIDEAPHIVGRAWYVDRNQNAICDIDDRVGVHFDRQVAVDALEPTLLTLLVPTDALGAPTSAAVMEDGFGLFQSLGDGAFLRTRGAFDTGITTANSPSGVDLRAGPPSSVVGTNGLPALPGGGIDVFPIPHDAGEGFGTHATQAVVRGDIDGDGDLDVVTIHGDAARPSLWRNDGVGTLTASSAAFGRVGALVAVLGDLDHDGDLDLVLGHGDGTKDVLANDGTGLFSGAGTLAGNTAVRALALADLDRDGNLDLVVASDGVEGSGVWVGDGRLAFLPTPLDLGVSTATCLALGDLDHDGDTDVVIGNGGSEPDDIYRNDGAGGFARLGAGVGTDDTLALRLVDADRDGDLDLVTLGQGEAPIQVWANDGGGAFTAFGEAFGPLGATTLTPADLDGDSVEDLVVGTQGGALSYWAGERGGTFSFVFASADETLAGPTTSVAAGDFDGDGDVDLVQGLGADRDTGAGVADRLLFGSLGGTWGSWSVVDSGQRLGATETQALVVGDLDGDGDLDLVAANNGGAPNTVWLNDSRGTFTDSGARLGAAESFAVALGDVDADGDLDIVIGNTGASGQVVNKLYLNDGEANFSDSGQSLGTGATYGVALGDVDTDGDLDVVLANWGGQPDLVWLNNGAGVFVDSGQRIGTTHSEGCVLGDVDRDGDLDLIVPTWNAVGNRVYMNDGSGTFMDSGQALGTKYTVSIAAGDVDGDGDLDLVAANLGFGQGAPNDLWLNDGTGLFSLAAQSVGARDSLGVSFGDIDGDGDLDVVVGDNGGSNQLYLNDGTGVFQTSAIIWGDPVMAGQGVLLVDVDADGDLDAIEGGPSAVTLGLGGAHRIWLNR